MTSVPEVTVTGARYWIDKPEQLAQLLATSRANSIPDPSGQSPSADEVLQLTRPQDWASSRGELHDALVFAVSRAGPAAVAAGSGSAAGAVAPVEDRLVYTVEEAASLLGISRSFAYEAVQKGDIPSMRIGLMP